ncbi:S-layer homology domain-containing protein [Bacillus thermotolerans]|uniref:SLH domain-containing protein n=1 Tax=Bacillus thermotolerans TaxID=1221996 RepID=A0A0F5HTH5_BACTR|nr:S-layer homology domain-containing protein [Bacillus thermotolerans]KKB36591.1 hypothetical protein QY95_03100 [Bacillus thermotolerans]
MKVFRVLLAVLLLGSLLPVSPASADVKSTDDYYIWDIGPDYRFYEEIERFVYSGIIDGYVVSEVEEEDGEVYEYSYVEVRPNEQVTRAQFTKILVNALSLKEGANTKAFPDVNPAKWHNEFIRIASSQGIISGREDGKFYPDQSITRDEMAMMIYRAFKDTVTFQPSTRTFKDVPASSKAYEAVNKLTANGIIQGYEDQTFKPGNRATRGQAIAIMDRALHQQTGSVTDMHAVTDVVNRNIQEEQRLMKEQDTAALEALYHDTATGYYLSLALESLELTGDMDELDGTLSITPISTHSLDLVTVRKNLAEVRIDDLVYEVSFTSPELTFTIKVNASGTAYLKKEADGKWKIYNMVLDEELEDEEEWEAEISAAANKK